MELVKCEIEVPKESKEMVDPVVALVKHFKDGKSIEEAAALLPMVMKGIDGMDKVGAEVKSEHVDALAAYLVMEIWGVFK